VKRLKPDGTLHRHKPVPAPARLDSANSRRRDALTRQRVAETIASSPNAARIERLVAWFKNLGQSEAGELIDTIEANGCSAKRRPCGASSRG
jgi:hypothetical protein